MEWLNFIFMFGIGLGTSSMISASSRPNVLFLVSDDLRPKLGCYGESNMVTPNIDQLASHSLLFQRAYVQQAVCSPSRTSFLTGRRPDTTRIFDLFTYFRELAGNYTTLPQHFKNNGYITQSVGKIFHPGVASGRTDDYPYSWTFPAYHGTPPPKTCKGPDGKLHNNASICPVNVTELPAGALSDSLDTDFAIQFLQNRSVDKEPFFLAVGYHKPHLPFMFPKEFLDLYPLSNIKLAPNPYYPPWLPIVAWSPWTELLAYDDIKAFNLTWPVGQIPLHYQLLLRQGYSAATSYIDEEIGRVLDALDRFGFSHNTIISLHGDHGWQLGEHGEWCKHTNFDIATRIPLMIHVPNVTSTSSVSSPMFPFIDALKNTRTTALPLGLGHEKRTSEYSRTEDGMDASKRNGIEGGMHSGVPLSTDLLVEAVDLYATLSELAGLPVPPTCPPEPFNVSFCTEGTSLVPVIKHVTRLSNRGVIRDSTEKLSTVIKTKVAETPTQDVHWAETVNMTSWNDDDASDPGFRWKNAVFSQYPRPTLMPSLHSEGPSLDTIRIMGYTMRTTEHRYTEWIAYDPTTFTANWSQLYARELYVYSSDPEENLNVAAVPDFQELVAAKSKQLRDGWRAALPETLA